MFWECHIVTSSIDKLLDQPNDTLKLQDFLDENDLIQECLTQNKRLIDYLIQTNIMNELIECIIKNPQDDNFHNAHVVSELLSGDFPRIQEKLIENEHFNLLYSFLITNETNLNPILASYFSRIITTLIIRKPNELFNSFKSCSTFKRDFLKHLYSTSITDVLYRLISDSADQRSEIIQWYEEINLIDGIIQEFIQTNSIYVQMNIVNLLTEFIRLAFDQHNGLDNDPQDMNNSNTSLSINQYSSNSKIENKAVNDELEGKFTSLTLAQHILSKANLERLFDGLSQKAILVANGCDFLSNILDLFHRNMPAPLCIFLQASSEENERMQINDEGGDAEPVTKPSEINANNLVKLTNSIQDPLIRIYFEFLQVIPSRLPFLITLLSNPSPPLITSSPTHENSQTIKYQFISEPLGVMRLNLIKFFSKLIHTISNDYTGDSIYQILNSNHLFNILIDLFYNHIYNNFLHTHVYQIIRHLFHINALAIKQPNNIWTRLPLNYPNQSEELELPNSSTYLHANRCSYKLLQSLLSSTEINLIERLLDQYELNLTSNKINLNNSSSDDAISSSLIQTRFTPPNSGHIIQILRCLREHASLFNNYTLFIKTIQQEQIEDNLNHFQIRWQTIIDHLNEEDNKWSSMHHNERNSISSFTMNAAASIMAHISSVIHLNDSSEANQRRQTFHMRSFGSSGAPYVDDDDDDDVERFNIDDELMNNERTMSEQQRNDSRKDKFESQFPPVFDEQAFWHQQDHVNTTNIRNNHDEDYKKMNLFENHQMQEDTSESNFEQFCSTRENDHGSGPVDNPFLSSSPSSSKVHDEVEEGQDEF